MQRLHESATASRLNRFVPFPTGTHNDTHYRGGQAYYRAMGVFMEEALKVNSGSTELPATAGGANGSNK
jgi:fermentation-respiration switch protein FrsA (DUF1100 family)